MPGSLLCKVSVRIFVPCARESWASDVPRKRKKKIEQSEEENRKTGSGGGRLYDECQSKQKRSLSKAAGTLFKVQGMNYPLWIVLYL